MTMGRISEGAISNTKHLNDLLKDIYETEMRISDILSKMEFPPGKIQELKDARLDVFFGHLEFAFQCKLFGDSNSRRAYQIICRRYGLFGMEKETLQAVGERFSISRERVRQLEQKAIRRMRAKYDPMAILITLSACKAVGIDPLEILNANADDTEDAEEGGSQ